MSRHRRHHTRQGRRSRSGVPLHVIDTAGLRDSDDEVERIGIARAWDEIAAADAVLFLHDLTRVRQTDYAAADAATAPACASSCHPCAEQD
ncbi:50S ribosome-binding GTPase [Staphylococcus epidermidis]|nr:50S ribosome-binding GTPase [Staphylococcus epidermidis]